MSLKKALLFVVLLGAIAGVVWLNLRSQGKKGEKVEVEKVERRTVTGIVEASGRLKPAVSVDLSSDVIGRVVEVRPREGDSVRAGDLLIRVDPSQYDYRVKSARAAADAAQSRLEEVRTNLVKARRELERDTSLHDEKLLSEQAFEAARAASESLESQLRTAEHSSAQALASLEEAEEQLRKTEIHAPRDGVVVRRNVEVGEVAVAGTLNNAGSLLMTIADLATMRAEVEVDETDVVHVAEGQAAEVKLDAFPDRVFRGTVVEVARSALLDGSSGVTGQTKSADYRVKVRIVDTDPLLRPDLSATARITTAVKDGVVAVPIQAVVVREIDEAGGGGEGGGGRSLQGGSARSAGGGLTASAEAVVPSPSPAGEGPGPSPEAKKKVEKEGIFAVDGGTARFRPVVLGIAGERYFEIVSGVKAGDLVVKGPFQTLRTLKDGDAVEAETKEAEALKARGAKKAKKP